MRCSRAIIERMPPPPGDPDAPLKALVYNSHFDTYKGVVVYVRVMEGTLRKGQRIQPDARRHRARRHRGRPVPARRRRRATTLAAGQVGYFMAQIKNLADVHIGDTVTDALNPTADGAAGLQGAEADGLQRPVPVEQQRLRGPARGAGQAPAQRLQLHLPARKSARGSASASAAASSACSTARSSSSAWSATATSTWCRPRRTSPTRS